MNEEKKVLKKRNLKKHIPKAYSIHHKKNYMNIKYINCDAV